MLHCIDNVRGSHSSITKINTMGLINKNVILKNDLYAAIGGGIARMPNGGRYSGISLYGSSEAAVSFPISRGGKGYIAEESSDGRNVVIRMTIKDGLYGLHSFNQFNLLVNKECLTSFFNVEQ